MEKKLVLKFYDAQLTETFFKHPLLESPCQSVRGKTAGAYERLGTFQWTTAVQALSLLLIETVLSYKKNPVQPEPAQLSGLGGTLASSLDYALSKSPIWMAEMFGSDSLGNVLSKRVIKRTNPNRKRPGPVVLSVNDNFIDFSSIEVVIDGCAIVEHERLNELSTELSRHVV